MYAAAGFLTACVMFGVYVTISRKGIGGNSKNMLDGEKEQHILYTLKADMKKGDKVSDEDLEHHVISVDREDNIKFPDKQDILGKEIKIDVSKGALIDKDIILTDEKADDSLRLQMYSGIELNPEVLEGSIVDIRIQFADGEDYVVASYKRVEKRGEDSIFVLLESNYDPEVLKFSRYPYILKSRIAGPNGHLPNETAGKTIAHLLQSGLQQAILGHLSKESNFPELAYKTVVDEIISNSNYNENSLKLSVASRDIPGTRCNFETDIEDKTLV